MDRITSINRFLVLYFIIYFLILTHPVQMRRSSLSSSNSASSSSNSLSQISGSCELALRKCSKQIACGMTLHDYRLSCKQVLYGTGKNCTEICQLAIVSLLSTPEGQQYLNCDCGSNDYCKQVKNFFLLTFCKKKKYIKLTIAIFYFPKKTDSCTNSSMQCKEC